MEYEYYHYNQIGAYRCTRCGHRKPATDYTVTGADLTKGELVIDGGVTIALAFRSIYNVYNILAAYAACRECGVGSDAAAGVINNYILKNGRMVKFTLGAHHGTLLTSKHENSVAYDTNLRYIQETSAPCTVLVIVDAVSRKYFTSETSWLWDIDFDRLHCGHGDLRQGLLLDLLAGSRKLGDLADVGGLGSLSAGVGIDLGIEDEDVDVVSGGQDVIQTAEADVIGPAVAAEDPHGPGGAESGHPAAVRPGGKRRRGHAGRGAARLSRAGCGGAGGASAGGVAPLPRPPLGSGAIGGAPAGLSGCDGSGKREAGAGGSRRRRPQHSAHRLPRRGKVHAGEQRPAGRAAGGLHHLRQCGGHRAGLCL